MQKNLSESMYLLDIVHITQKLMMLEFLPTKKLVNFAGQSSLIQGQLTPKLMQHRVLLKGSTS